MSALAFVLAGTLAAATPLLLAALGELVAERSGVINLGIEGLMAVGAALAFAVVYQGGGHGLAFLVGAMAGCAGALVFAAAVLVFRAGQVAAGLAVGLLTLGLSALLGAPFESLTVTGLPKLALPVLSDLPLVGSLARQDAAVWLTLTAAAAIAWAIWRTRVGLVLRAVGENPRAARATGIPVRAVRAAAIAFGGAMAGLGGAYAATVYTPLWADGMIAGRGWIALALVVFGTWRVGRVVLGALLFGALSLAELAAQAVGVGLPSQLLASLPYLATILVLGLISMDRRRLKAQAVASLGEPYEP